MKTLKPIVLLLLMILSPISAYTVTREPVQQIEGFTIYSKLGDEVSFEFSEKPLFTYEENMMVVSTNNDTIYFDLQDIDKIMFGIEKPVGLSSHDGKQQSEEVKVYTQDGKLVLSLKQPLKITSLSPGFYIIKSQESSYKIQVR